MSFYFEGGILYWVEICKTFKTQQFQAHMQNIFSDLLDISIVIDISIVKYSDDIFGTLIKNTLKILNFKKI